MHSEAAHALAPPTHPTAKTNMPHWQIPQVNSAFFSLKFIDFLWFLDNRMRTYPASKAPTAVSQHPIAQRYGWRHRRCHASTGYSCKKSRDRSTQKGARKNKWNDTSQHPCSARIRFWEWYFQAPSCRTLTAREASSALPLASRFTRSQLETIEQRDAEWVAAMFLSNPSSWCPPSIAKADLQRLKVEMNSGQALQLIKDTQSRKLKDLYT